MIDPDAKHQPEKVVVDELGPNSVPNSGLLFIATVYNTEITVLRML